MVLRQNAIPQGAAGECVCGCWIWHHLAGDEAGDWAPELLLTLRGQGCGKDTDAHGLVMIKRYNVALYVSILDGKINQEWQTVIIFHHHGQVLSQIIPGSERNLYWLLIFFFPKWTKICFLVWKDAKTMLFDITVLLFLILLSCISLLLLSPGTLKLWNFSFIHDINIHFIMFVLLF